MPEVAKDSQDIVSILTHCGKGEILQWFPASGGIVEIDYEIIDAIACIGKVFGNCRADWYRTSNGKWRKTR